MNGFKKGFKIVGKSMRYLATSLGALVLIGVCLGLFLRPKPYVPEQSILKISIGQYPLNDQPHQFSFPFYQKGSFPSLLESIDRAKNDNRIKGILLNIEGSEIGTAHIQELRDHLKQFKQSKKIVYAYAASFGELSNGTKGYYLASVADKIFLQPVGSLNLTGFYLEAPFLRKILEDHKVNPQIETREDYKTAAHMYTQKEMTPQNKEQINRILESMSKNILKDIAQDRKLDSQSANTLFDNGPYLDNQALANKLIDHISYYTTVIEDIKQHVNKGKTPKTQKKQYTSSLEADEEKIAYISPTTYLKNSEPVSAGDHEIAIVHVEGAIVSSKKNTPFSEEIVAASEDIAPLLEKLTKDESIKGIILRVDSPGGSAVASQTIYHYLMQAKAKKPVVVSMSNYAASGGYLIACGADYIIAEPGTLTGSIGVFGGKIVTGEFWRHYGVNWEGIKTSPQADMWSNSTPYTPEAHEKLKASMDQIYQDFMNKVAKGRKLSKEATRELAQGKVYTGIEAKKFGLVDELGGLTHAIAKIKKLAKLPDESTIEVVHYPHPKNLAEELLSFWDESGTQATMFSKFTQILKSIDIFLPTESNSANKALKMPFKLDS